MLTKMRDSKGFTLVELMIVVAIIGILAAVAVPYYQRYVAKSRLTSLVIPGSHAMETDIGTSYAVKGSPGYIKDKGLDTWSASADTACFTLENLDASDGSIVFHVVVDAESDLNKCGGLKQLDGMGFTAKGAYSDDGKMYWSYEGGLADELGL